MCSLPASCITNLKFYRFFKGAYGGVNYCRNLLNGIPLRVNKVGLLIWRFIFLATLIKSIPSFNLYFIYLLAPPFCL